MFALPRMSDPDPSTVAAWTRLVSVSGALVARVEAALKAEGLPPLGWYDALLELERAGDAGLRPFALEARLLLPQYGTSRLLRRLQEAGYVARAPCREDARGHVVVITAEGKAVRARMWPVYAAALDGLIAARLDTGERERLAALLERLRP